MNIFLNNTSGVPLYEQLKEQIKTQIIEGSLKQDEMLPSMRALAADLRVSLITTKRAYEDLIREGFLYSLSTRGVCVAKLDKGKVRKEIVGMVEKNLAEACIEAKKIDLSFSEISKLLKEVFNKTK
ncbi:GntR family transcriptional regulator [Treponema phagedenis]|uniref:GntR family transcriptional regulator n=1 Tax=Treponema phagedenis TaxID=162 RepID=A0A0B7GWH1_TREPH|nr:GntR family transcriptional regulator [Treponema phagedenis]EFW37621.1 transcriptional regulator, GntR family [Treponema phagedenis F0421]NVP22787.1 GntR family transcriptional regulator [Treponema phagedenis]QEJ95260.1 GntR family transcriptional regulator [Treponema phagedenis]QEJ98363.1 GntR family transcriptional regulator [Treponema phagedenis]QEK01113.1 GntR family transcriptional regulator [Treponema phagedenis]